MRAYVAIAAVAIGGMMAYLFIQESLHPCQEYGPPEVVETVEVHSAGSSTIVVPVTHVYHPCLRRK